MVAHVRNVKGCAVSELVLHAEIVLVRRWTIVGIAEGENSSGRLRRVEIERSERRKRAARHIRNDVAGQLLAKRTGLRQRVASSEDAEAAADHQVFHRLWLPRDADARLKIPIMVWKRGTRDSRRLGRDESIGHGAQRRIHVARRWIKRGSGTLCRIVRADAEIRDVVRGGKDLREDLIAQAQVQGQVLRNLIGVLRIQGIVAFAVIDRV